MPKPIRLRLEELDGRITPVAGALDPTFNGSGFVTQDIPGYYQTGGEDVLVQPDGKVVVAGTARLVDTMFPAVYRYNANGTLDTSFGLSGFGILNIPNGTGQLYSVVEQPDGKLVASGTARILGNYQALLVRLNSDGTLDTSFGTGGLVLVDPSAGDDNGFDVALQPDGKIVVVGNSQPNPTQSSMRTLALRFNADGSLDTTFDSDGIVQLASGPIARAVVVQTDGKMVLGGENTGGQSAFTLVRLNADGSLDTTFDGDGLVQTTPAGMAYEDIRDVVLQPDGKIVAVGTAAVNGGSSGEPIVLRYTSDGALDSTFDSDGIVVLTLAQNSGEGNAVALQGDGRILVGGDIGIPGSGSNSIIARLATDGQLDTSFGPTDTIVNPGVVMTDLAPSDGEDYVAVAVAPDGSIVTVGVAGTGSVRRLSLARYDSIDLPAVAVADEYALDQHTVLTVASPGVLANDRQPGGAAVAIVVTHQPAHGSLSLNQLGGFTYTPTSAFVGTDGFEYKLNNGLPSDPVAVTLVVRPVAAPPITGVSSTADDGVYGVGSTIPITITFSGPVTVTGVPQLALETGTNAAAYYSGGSGTNTLTFLYTVIAGDNTADLDYTSPFALSLNGGTIQDGAGKDVVLTLNTPGTVGSLGAAKDIVIDTPIITLSAPSGSVDENAAGGLVYTFTRSGMTTNALTVNFFVTGSAVFGSDYSQTGAETFDSTSDTVTFAAGSSSATVEIDPISDGVTEYDESVVLALAPGAGYSIISSPATQPPGPAVRVAQSAARTTFTFATGGIANDDKTSLKLSGGTAQYEGNAGTTAYTFTVRLNKDVAGGFSVPYTTNNGTATAGSDYIDNDGTLTFAGTAGESQTVTVLVSGDGTAESDETFTVALGALTGPNQALLNAISVVGSSQTGTIVNDDRDVGVAVSPPSVAEDGSANLVYTFTRSGDTTRALTVNFSVGGSATFGSDYKQTGATSYTATTGMVTFGAGSSTATVTVNPTADLTTEPDEDVVLTVTSGTGYNIASSSTATGTIANDDTLPPDTTITSGPAAVVSSRTATFQFAGLTNPPGGSLTFQISLDGAPFQASPSLKKFINLPDGPHTLLVRAVDSSGRVDPTPATYTWVVDATKPTVAISSPSAAIAKAGDTITYTVTYTDANLQAVTLTAAGVTLNKTGTANGTVQVSGTGNTRTVTISGISGDGMLGITIKANSAIDQVGLLAAASRPSAKFVVDNRAPVVSITTPTRATVGGVAVFTVTYTDGTLAPASLAASQVTVLSPSGLTGIVTVTQVAANRFTVRVSALSGPGTFSISIAEGVAEDALGRLSLGPVTSRSVAVR